MKSRLFLIKYAEKYSVTKAAIKYKSIHIFTAGNSTYSSSGFVKHLIRHFPTPVEYVQTDPGAEFYKRLTQPEQETLTMFQCTLKHNDIHHKRIKPFTPRLDGKVKRSHRKDNERFYATHKFYSFKVF